MQPRNFMRFQSARSMMATVGRMAWKEVRSHSTCQGALRYCKAFIEKRRLVNFKIMFLLESSRHVYDDVCQSEIAEWVGQLTVPSK